MRPSTRQDWLAAAALLAGLLAAYAMPPASTGSGAARAVAAMAIGALVALAVARAPFTFAPRIRTAFVLLVLLSLWYVATRAWALDPAGSMVESSRVSAFVLMAWASHTTVVGTAARRALLAGIAAVATYVAAPHLIDLVRDGAPEIRVDGALGYWNATAIVALCLVPIGVALAGTGRRSLQLLGALTIPVAGIAAVATASRGALAALLVALLFQALLDPDYRGGLPRALVAILSLGLVIAGFALDLPSPVALGAPVLVAFGGFAAIGRRRTRREARRLAVVHEERLEEARPRRRPSGVQVVGALIVASLMALLVMLVLDANQSALPPRGVATVEGEGVERLTSTDDSRRTAWWREALGVWKENPLIGAGGRAFDVVHVDGEGDNADHAHSLPIEILLETGLIGFALLLGASFQFLRVLRHGRRSTERALAGALAALLLAQALVDWTLSFPQVLALLAIAGPLAVQPPPGPDADGVGQSPPVWGPLAMLGSLAAATTVAVVPVLAVLIADQAARAFDDGNPRKAASLAEQSLVLVPSLDTLTVQVISLQAAGQEDAARDVLRDNEQVWFTRIEGLLLARDLLADDPKLASRIERRIEEIQNDRAARVVT